jgi:hypothetical protein
MKSLTPIRWLYVVSAAYDGLLGLAFLVAGPALFRLTGITPPNHWGYVHFPACLLVVFGLLFLRIASDPVRYRELVPFGVLLKVSYVGTVGWHWLGEGLPDLWKYFAVADATFALLFLATYRALRTEGA